MAKLRAAQGGIYHFWCPGCKCAHGFGPGWTFNGNMETPTVLPSLLTTFPMLDADNKPIGEMVCHIILTNGQLQFLPDCKHELAGKTCPMEDF